MIGYWVVIAKTSATWCLKIASKSSDAFFQEKGERFRDFSFVTSDGKISWIYLYSVCQKFTQIGARWSKIESGSRSLSTCPYHWFYPLCHTGFTWRESTFIKEKCENRGLVWNGIPSEMNEVFTLYCTATIWQLQNNTYIFQKVSFLILYLCI